MRCTQFWSSLFLFSRRERTDLMNENYDLVETANQAGNFRVFLQALEAAGLRDTLKETGPLTILAPVDDAFLKIPQT
ncbi:MAG TPA: fasciclin domain-containing protein, partial [Candidatus Binatia bacterium]|nr:fasciclin domain-containing protein [Candidatus Binatia bacterium]